MKTRLVLLTVFGLTAASAAAQAPAPSRTPAPSAGATSPAPAVPAAVVAPQPVAPQPVTPQPVAAPPRASQPAVSQPAAQPDAVQPVAPPPYMAPPPPAGTLYMPPPPYEAPQRGRRYRLAPPRLHAVTPERRREPRHYGDAGAPLAIGIGGSVLWRNDDGYRLLDDDDVQGAFELFVTYDVWTPFRGAVVAVGTSVRTESLHRGEDVELQHTTLQAELMARFEARPWLWPHLRVAVGGALTSFDQTDRAAGIDYEDRTGGVASTFGAGLTLRTPTRLFETRRGKLASLSLGLLLEGGYSLAQQAELSATPAQSGELPRATFGLGKLDRSAAYLRIAGVIRF